MRIRYVVFGANSYVGSYVYKRLTNEGAVIIGTSRRRSYFERGVPFDIYSDDVVMLDKCIDDKTSCLICIAEARIDVCYEKRDYAYDVNVTRMKILVDRLLKRGAYIVFLSTDNVFDGQDGSYKEKHPTHPINQYGMMKTEMEQYLLERCPKACVFRLSKVVGNYADKKNLFTIWEDQIERKEIPCIKNNIISFVCQEDIYQAYLCASKEKLHGIYHISGNISYSRKELAEKFLIALGRKNDVYVREYELAHFDFKDNRPLNVSLDNRKFKQVTGYDFTDMENVMEQYIASNKNS